MQNVLGTRVHQSCDQRLPQCNRQLTQRVQSKNSRRLKFIDYMSGYKRMIAELKEEGEMPLHEGKEPIAVDGYRYLAQKALDGERDKKGRRTVHLFLLLCWNLIARTATVGSLRYDHVTWEGVSVKEVGTHSFRKGVASELSNNPGCPTPVSVHLRAGWTLGPVQGRYIFSGSGGDQFVGRAAAGSFMYT
ncbi:hypothetical protein Ae201684P_012791 [Aphanomyces euteiches]|nr:hypothetical protein Ae201684P_012791 [Aphanomyces euteiches]